ncbi:hypothetical protein LTR22_008450 [Elasticomyces elasticus]|nr:hypothetical protein LTR22_008450 [Elasticomyces elasticus]KAK4923261.1 hypothetical protein LTR49_009524 [Elasticomyces elasticus]
MASISAVGPDFDEEYNEARGLFDNDDLVGAIDKAQNLLDDSTLPRYHRIKLLLLLSASVSDWHEVDTLLEEARTLWRLARRCIGANTSADAEHVLAVLRESLDTLQAQHEAEDPDIPLQATSSTAVVTEPETHVEPEPSRQLPFRDEPKSRKDFWSDLWQSARDAPAPVVKYGGELVEPAQNPESQTQEEKDEATKPVGLSSRRLYVAARMLTKQQKGPPSLFTYKKIDNEWVQVPVTAPKPYREPKKVVKRKEALREDSESE